MACFFRGMTYSIGTGLGTNNKPKIKENMITTIFFFFWGVGGVVVVGESLCEHFAKGLGHEVILQTKN